MLAALSSIEAWDGIDWRVKEQIALRVERAMAPLVRFRELEAHALGQQEHTVAVFDLDGTSMTLLPGYLGTLGYDPAMHPQPEQIILGWKERPELTEFSQARDLPAAFRQELTPARTVSLCPFLVATTATRLRKVDRSQAGVTTFETRVIRRSEILAEITKAGLRFPSSDEWEYACSGGSRAFFRWGNNWPPFRWNDMPACRDTDEWREDLKPNAFGLLIGIDPWRLEYCAEPEVIRGGDGGGVGSVGAELEEEWLPFATSYRYPFTAKFVELLHDPWLRVVVSVPEFD